MNNLTAWGSQQQRKQEGRLMQNILQESEDSFMCSVLVGRTNDWKTSLQHILRSPVFQKLASFRYFQARQQGAKAASPRLLLRKNPSLKLTQQQRIDLLFCNYKLSSNTSKCRGLINGSQRCFANAVLQSLASLPSIITYLQSSVWLLLLQKQNLDNEKTLLLDSLLELLLQLHHGFLISNANRTLDGQCILTHVASHYKQFRSSSTKQQDAEEFLTALLNLVTKEINEQTFLLFTNNSTNHTLLQHQHKLNNDKESLLQVIENSSVSFSSLSQQLMEMSSTIISNIDIDERIYAEPQGDDNHVDLHDSTSINSFDEEEKKSHDDDDYHQRFQLTGSESTSKRRDCSTHASERVNAINGDGVINYVLLSATIQNQYEQLFESPLAYRNKMISTLIPTASSPFSGWLGSFLQCCTCQHVRPVQNAPFIDLPVIPTSITELHNSRRLKHASAAASPSSPLPKCYLEDTLYNFTSTERVTGVSCRCCAIEQAKNFVFDEILMLQQAIAAIRNKKHSSTPTDALQADLKSLQETLTCLNLMHPDDEDVEDNNKQIFDEDSPLQIAKSLISKQSSMVKRESFKRLLITRLPPVLCLHVQRRYYKASQNCMAKAMQIVDFSEILDVAPFTSSNDKKKILYRLMSVVEHIGNANFGHYVTFRRFTSAQPGVAPEIAAANTVSTSVDRWYRISDESVQLVEWSDVKRCQAYLLFYEAL